MNFIFECVIISLISAIYFIFYVVLDTVIFGKLAERRRINCIEDLFNEHPELCPGTYAGNNTVCFYCPHGKECKKDCRKEKQQKEQDNGTE